jgi:DNA polymerase III subunit gamma/tau
VALALYRKYRPATFADVVGQEHVTEPLRTALAAGRINHAYLFSGPRGCGKTSSARILARSLNCELGPTPDPCGRCPSCVALAPEGPGNIDVIELDAASHGGVDDARELRDRAFYAPAESRYRVFIIDEAHMVTTQGFNALLKIVEEPPEHLVFVFATTEPDKVLPTIRSRTHHYPFRLIAPGTLRALLERICAAEGVTVAPSAFPLVIRAGGGSARDTLSVLDQLLAGAGPEGVTYERAVALLGVTDVALIDDAVDALAARDGAALFEAVDRLVEAGHDPRRFAADLLDRFRDLILVHAVPDVAARGLVDAPADELERMADQATRLGAATLSRYAEIVHTGLTEMRGATAPRLLLELLCGRMLLPAASTSDLALLERLERIERRADIVVEPRPGDGGPGRDGVAADHGGADAVGGVGSGAVPPVGRTFQRRSQAGEASSAAASGSAAGAASVAPPPASDPPSSAVPPGQGAGSGASVGSTPGAVGATAEPTARPDAEASVGPPPIDAAAVRRAWPEILETAKRASRSTGALLVNATVRAVERDTLVLSITAAPLARRLAEQRNTEVISAALRAVLGVAWQVRCEHDTGGAGGRGAGTDRGPATSTTPRGDRTSGNGRDTDPDAMGRTSLTGRTPGPPVPPSQANRPDQANRPNPPSRSDSRDRPGSPSRSDQLSRPGSANPPGSPSRSDPPSRPDASSRRESDEASGRTSRGPGRPSTRPPRDDEPPLPPEPPPDDEPYDDEEEAVSNPADDGVAPNARRDPEEVAIELLSAQLGARTVEDRR